MDKDRETNLLKKAMEATHDTSMSMKNKPDCDDIESTVYGELEKAHEWLQHPHHRTVIKEGIPVFQAIEKTMDYIGRTNIPQWEVKEFMTKIDLLLTEWASKRSAATGEDLRTIMEKFHVHDNEPNHCSGKCCHGKRHVEVTDDQDEVESEPAMEVKYEPADIPEKRKKAMENINEELKKIEDTDSFLKGFSKENNSKASVRDHNVGCSDYSKHKIQPWDIWEEYNLNPWDADIVKRVLREKEDGRPATVTRIEDYNKIIHVCQERIRQIQTNGHV